MAWKNFEFKDSTEAWEKLNEMFIVDDPDLESQYISKALYSKYLNISIKNPRLDPKFDFGRYFNYTKSKWISLVNNYLDLEELKLLRDEIAATKKKIYNLSYQFKNKHGHGKGCLVSAIFSKIPEEPLTITVFIRSSEVTKRLPMDLLLIQRMGEYVFKGHFEIRLVVNQMFNDDSVLLMYNTHKPIKKVFKGTGIINTERKDTVLATLNKLISQDPKDVKYKVHRRAVKVLRPDLCRYPNLKAKDCVLNGLT